MTKLIWFIQDLLVIVICMVVLPLWLIYQGIIWLFGYEDILAKLLFQCGKDDEREVEDEEVLIPGVEK